MRVLVRRAIGDADVVADAILPCLGELEPGLRLVARRSVAGEVTVDLAAVDAQGRLVLVLCEALVGPETPREPSARSPSSAAAPAPAPGVRLAGDPGDRATALIEGLQRLRVSGAHR